MTENETRESQRAARYALAVLTFINLFNYLDRWVVAAVVESIKRSELHLSDTQLGFVGTGFIVVYTLTSPLFGALGDRRGRPPLIAIGVAVWSIATALAGFARGFLSLFSARSGCAAPEISNDVPRRGDRGDRMQRCISGVSATSSNRHR